MAFDTYICAMQGVNFKEFVKKKHGYTDKEFDKLTILYRNHLGKITITDTTDPECAIFE